MTAGRWHSFPPLADGTGVHVRVAERDGRSVITEIVVQGDEITAATLRAIPIGRYEAMADQSVAHDRMVSALLPEEPEPTLAELRGTRAHAKRRTRAATQRRGKRRPRLARPDGADPETFYAAVAEAYREYAAETRAAAARIADEAAVPVTTAHRWVREARRRGHLPAGRKGRTL